MVPSVRGPCCWKTLLPGTLRDTVARHPCGERFSVNNDGILWPLLGLAGRDNQRRSGFFFEHYGLVTAGALVHGSDPGRQHVLGSRIIGGGQQHHISTSGAGNFDAFVEMGQPVFKMVPPLTTAVGIESQPPRRPHSWLLGIRGHSYANGGDFMWGPRVASFTCSCLRSPKTFPSPELCLNY